METLARTSIEPIGDLQIKSDAKPEQFFEGLGSFVTFESEQGDWQRIDAVIVTQEENQALLEVTKMLAEPTSTASKEFKEHVEERIGPVDWNKIASRYERLTTGR